MKQNNPFENRQNRIPVSGSGQKRFALILLSLLVTCLLTACGEQTCAYCGETKKGKEYDVLGNTRFICHDCLNNPAAHILSGNVIQEYACKPINISDNITLNTDYFSVPVDDRNPALDTSYPSEADTKTEDYDNPPQTEQPAVENTTPGEGENSAASAPAPAVFPNYGNIVNSLNSSYSSSGMQLVSQNPESTIFRLENNGNDMGIRFVFTNANSSNPALSIQRFENASAPDYTSACINGILSYIGSADYNGIGYEIYTQTISNSSSTYSNCSFFSNHFDNAGTVADAPTDSFDISSQPG